MDAKKFTGQEGKFISSEKAAGLTKRFRDGKEKEGEKPGTYVEAQFYGNKQLERLMKKEGCVGLRFYRAVSEDQDLNDQIVVVAVNADGKDLTRTRIGLKDMPGGDDDDALAEGPKCPHDCNP